MTFLNPALLFGLFAISIPILIHLLNLRKVRKIEFSTLMFLREIQKTKMKRIKLKQLLLLILRIFTILFLVLCFARPVYEGYAGSGSNSASTALIFLDNSFSMSAKDEKGILLDQAKKAAQKILELYKETDEVHLIPVSFLGMKNLKTYYSDFGELRDSLDKIKIGYKPAFFDDVISYSNKIFSESKNSNKEIFFISDLQKTNFNSQLDGNEFERLNEINANIYFIRIGRREVKNVSLDSFTVTTKILEKEKNVKIKLSLVNNNDYNVKNKIVNLYIDNKLISEKAVDVDSYGKKEVEFNFKPTASGNVNGMIELVQNEFQDDELIQDNNYYFTLYIPDHFEIGIISGKSYDDSFIRLALETASRILSDSLNKQSSLFNINNELSVSENIFKNNILFIVNKNKFSDEESELLKKYVSQGGGIFLFPGSNTDINNYNSELLNKLATVRIEKLNSDKTGNENLKFGRVDFQNAVLSEIFSNPKLNLTDDNFNVGSPKINSYFELLPNQNSNDIITLSNNKPFLIESKLSKGRIIISSVAATDDFSDFPLKNIFVPIIIRSIYYLSNDFEIQNEYITGNSNLIKINDLGNISEIVLPDKNKHAAVIDFINKNENYLYLPYDIYSSQPGKYILIDSSGKQFTFSMNVNPAESNTSVITKDDFNRLISENNIKNLRMVESPDDIKLSIEQSRTGFNLWKYFLLAALICLAGEFLLTKNLEKGS